MDTLESLNHSVWDCKYVADAVALAKASDPAGALVSEGYYGRCYDSHPL
jgi:hypothetical protein